MGIGSETNNSLEFLKQHIRTLVMILIVQLCTICVSDAVGETSYCEGVGEPSTDQAEGVVLFLEGDAGEAFNDL